MNKLKRSMMAVAVSSLLTVPAAQATNGYFSDGYGAKSRGMGGAGVALSMETGSILQNPAAAATLGGRYDVAAGLFSPHPRSVTIENNDVGLNTIDFSTGATAPYVSGRNEFVIPFLGYNMSLNDKSAVALTVSALGGMNTDYSQHPFDSFHPANNPAVCPPASYPCATFGNLGIDLKQVQIAGTYGIELSKGLSVGVSLGLVIQQFQAHGLAPFTGFSVDPTKVTDTGKSRSTGIGANLGVMYDMGNGISFGLQYAPSVDMGEFDEYAGLFAEKGDFDIPSHYSAGVAWQASKDVLVAFDYRRINYTDVASISNDAQRLTDLTSPTSCIAGNPAACLGGAQGAGFGWDDQDIYKIGVAVDHGDGLTSRIGWNHGDAPIKAEDAVINIIAPATTEDHLTVGFTKALDTKSEVSFNFIRSFENKITGDVPVAFSSGQFGNPTPSPGTATIGMAQKFFEVNYARSF